METLSRGYKKLVEETLTVEDPGLKKEPKAEMKQENKPAKSQDFFQNNKAANHQKIKYTTTRIKFRNFLSNIAYIGINKEEYYNKNLPFDLYMLSTKNLNPFSLDRKLADKNKHEMIYMLWREYIPSEY